MMYSESLGILVGGLNTVHDSIHQEWAQWCFNGQVLNAEQLMSNAWSAVTYVMGLPFITRFSKVA